MGLAGAIGPLKPGDQRRHGRVLACGRRGRATEHHVENRLDGGHLPRRAAQEHHVRRRIQGRGSLPGRCLVEQLANLGLGGQRGHGGIEQSRQTEFARAARPGDIRPARAAVGVGRDAPAPPRQLRPQRNRHEHKHPYDKPSHHQAAPPQRLDAR